MDANADCAWCTLAGVRFRMITHLDPYKDSAWGLEVMGNTLWKKHKKSLLKTGRHAIILEFTSTKLIAGGPGTFWTEGKDQQTIQKN